MNAFPLGFASASGAMFWRAASEKLQGGVGGLLSFASCALLPSTCSLCGSPLPRLTEASICNLCWCESANRRTNCCACCGEDLFEPAPTLDTALSGDIHGRRCRACRMAPPAFVKAVSFGIYAGSLRGLIHAYKFERLAPVAKELGPTGWRKRSRRWRPDAPREDAGGAGALASRAGCRSEDLTRRGCWPRSLLGNLARKRTGLEAENLSAGAVAATGDKESSGLDCPRAPPELARRFFCL